MPSLPQLDMKMKEWSTKWSYPLTYPEGSGGEGIFNSLWRIQEKYAARNPRPQLGLQVNFERVLGEMNSLAAWVTPSPLGATLREIVRDASVSDSIAWPAHDNGPYAERNLIVEQQAFLLQQLANHMRGLCAKFEVSHEDFKTYQAIVDALRGEFELGIYNLNYDDLAVRAWPEAFNGFDGKMFVPNKVGSRSEWNFIYHLHGSVHYSLVTEPPFNHGVEWKGDLTGEFVDSKPLEVNMASGFFPIVPTTLIAGGFKLDQLMWDPAQTFYGSLIRHSHEADAVLFVGYGFGDAHVNKTLQNRFRLSPYNPKGRPPAVVITKSTPSAATIGERQGYEYFAWELTHTINARFPTGASTPPVPDIATLLNEKLFERDYYKRSAVWHGGFLEVRNHLDALLGSLAL
jgi:hypothetical protein